MLSFCRKWNEKKSSLDGEFQWVYCQFNIFKTTILQLLIFFPIYSCFMIFILYLVTLAVQMEDWACIYIGIQKHINLHNRNIENAKYSVRNLVRYSLAHSVFNYNLPL